MATEKGNRGGPSGVFRPPKARFLAVDRLAGGGSEKDKGRDTNGAPRVIPAGGKAEEKLSEVAHGLMGVHVMDRIDGYALDVIEDSMVVEEGEEK